MRITTTTDSTEITSELSKRFRQYRIAYPMTQADLAEKSMVSLSTIKRFENGYDIGLSNLVKLMGALDLQSNLEMLIPDQSMRPSAFVENTRPRQRARKRTTKTRQWKWGDEE